MKVRGRSDTLILVAGVSHHHNSSPTYFVCYAVFYLCCVGESYMHEMKNGGNVLLRRSLSPLVFTATFLSRSSLAAVISFPIKYTFQASSRQWIYWLAPRRQTTRQTKMQKNTDMINRQQTRKGNTDRSSSFCASIFGLSSFSNLKFLFDFKTNTHGKPSDERQGGWMGNHS